MINQVVRVSPQALANASRAVRVFLRIADAWSLSASEAAHLLGITVTELGELRVADRQGLDDAIAERLSYVLSIYASLAVLLPKPERAHGWLDRPNSAPMFGGLSAKAFLMGGGIERLAAVAAYLASERVR